MAEGRSDAWPTRSLTAEEKAEHSRDLQRAWPERNREHVREQKRAWKAANPDKVRQYSEKHHRLHQDRINELERIAHRRRIERAQKREHARERAREYQRRYIEAHPDRHRAASLAYIARQLQKDPEGFRAHRREVEREWYHRNRDRITARIRDRYQEDSTLDRARARRYYERHAEQIKQRNRERYAANAEQRRAYQRDYRRREKQRRENGLPPDRLHRVKPSERDANLAAATGFFTADVTPERRDRIRGEQFTPPELIAAHQRGNARYRAALGYEELRDGIAIRRQVSEDRKSTREQERARLRAQQRAAEEAEAARLDAIGAVINARLRPPPTRGPRHHNEPHPVFPSPDGMAGPTL